MIKSKKSDNKLEYLRVFTISLNGSLIEWCLNKLSPKVKDSIIFMLIIIKNYLISINYIYLELFY